MIFWLLARIFAPELTISTSFDLADLKSLASTVEAARTLVITVAWDCSCFCTSIFLFMPETRASTSAEQAARVVREKELVEMMGMERVGVRRERRMVMVVRRLVGLYILGLEGTMEVRWRDD